MPAAPDARFEGRDCTLSIRRPAGAVVVVTLSGSDVGEFRDAPFRELEKDLAAHARVELFIDARRGKGASIHVSGEWAAWLGRHKARFRRVHMLTGSRFIQLSAEFVRRFADLGELMLLYTDPPAFEGALADAVLAEKG